LITESADRKLRLQGEVLVELRDRAKELGLATSKLWLAETSHRLARATVPVIAALQQQSFDAQVAESLLPIVRQAIEVADDTGMLLTAEVNVADWRGDDFEYLERLVQVHQELVACLTTTEMELRRRVPFERLLR